MSASPLFLRSAGLSDDWRPIDRLLHRWVRAHGGDEALARLAGAISAAESDGHSALSAADVERYGARWPSEAQVAGWRQAGWLGERDEAAPFVLDAGQRLYLRRYARLEAGIAARLAAMVDVAAATPMTPDGDRRDGRAVDVDALFGSEDGDGRDAAQRAAVRRCDDARLFVLTGGPGTGKTTTVLRMLLAVLARAGTAPRIAVAAPTGKAAQRLVQSLRDGLDRLPEALHRHPHWGPALSRFALPEATTVHRLLGFHPHRRAFAHDARRPLDVDLLIVDEASMLDLEMLAALCAALPPQAALWLVGDADQLSPVGPGSALQDLGQALDDRRGAPLQRLRHGFRAASAPAALNAAVLAGDLDGLRDAFAAHPEALRWHTDGDAAALHRTLDAWADALIATRSHATLASLRERQWLCALRQGPFGVDAINARVDARLRAAATRDGLAGPDGHYPGRRLLVTRNDRETDLFNGDVGLVMADDDGRLRAWFEGDSGPRAIALGALPAHEPAFALSVHKSQGSEYDEVTVLLPDDPANPILSRELLYTAASRARQHLVLHGSEGAVAACLARPVRRSGGLHARLAEALSAPAPADRPVPRTPR